MNRVRERDDFSAMAPTRSDACRMPKTARQGNAARQLIRTLMRTMTSRRKPESAEQEVVRMGRNCSELFRNVK
jgi:hypothetical protein